MTGGAGFIGSHLVDRLIKEGWAVAVLDDLSTGRPENLGHHANSRRFRLIRGSILDRKLIHGALRDVDVIFHLAAVSSVVRSISDPEFGDNVNIHGTLKLLDEARLMDVERVIFASSSAVYGNAHQPPLNEDLLPSPDSPYAATKLAGEAYCVAFSRTYGLGTTVLRYFNVYGPRCRSGEYGAVMMQFAKRLASGEPLTVYGDGKQTRDFVYVDDVVEANMRAAKSKEAGGQIFNIGTGKKTTINGLAGILIRESGAKETRILHEGARSGEIRDSWASVSKAKRALGYTQKTALSLGIRNFLQWYRAEYTQ